MNASDLSHVHSFLFTPGHQPARFDKALASGAGAVILDLEDAVPDAEKAAARHAISDWISKERPVLVRINGVHSREHDDDLILAGQPGIAGLVLPKAESADQIARVSARCPDTPILALVETARGVQACAQLAAQPAVARLVFGAIDFCLDTGIAASDALEHVRVQLVVAARAARIAAPEDGVTPEFADLSLTHASAVRARALGFGAKLCIHPAQVALVNAAFRPTPEQVHRARRVLQAGAASGFAAIPLDGQMLDAPLFAQAARIVAEADATSIPGDIP